MPIIHWNGTDLPDSLRALPPGRYVVAPLAETASLSPDEEQGLIEALASLQAGRGVPHAEVEARAKAVLDELTAEAEKLGLGY